MKPEEDSLGAAGLDFGTAKSYSKGGMGARRSPEHDTLSDGECDSRYGK